MINNKRFLVVGGAGYIGSHVARNLSEDPSDILILDNFSTGHKEFVKGYDFIECDLQDLKLLRSSLEQYSFESVFHLAAKSIVQESGRFPVRYIENNLIGSLNLIQVCKELQIPRFIFSSTAAVYEPSSKPLLETCNINPKNNYGFTKLCIEKILENEAGHDFNVGILRYFNVAGASQSGEIGELHDPETHLIPNILKAIINDEMLEVYGNDYNTPDKTCIRDYVHVEDIAKGHRLLNSYLRESKSSYNIFNLGSNSGYSILEVIERCSEIADSKINYVFKERRSGDPDILLASNLKAKDELQWLPEHSLDQIILSAMNFHNINGFKL